VLKQSFVIHLNGGWWHSIPSVVEFIGENLSGKGDHFYFVILVKMWN
jgi:hypothetical protein